MASFAEKVNPFLLHEEETVRQFVLHLLAEGHLATEETFLLGLQANERQTHQNPYKNSVLPYLKNYPQTEKVFIALLNGLKTNPHDQHWYVALLDNSPSWLLAKYDQDLAAVLPDKLMKRFRLYQSWASMPSGDLYAELLAHMERMEYMNTFSLSHFQLGQRAIRELSVRKDWSCEQLLDIVQLEEKEPFFTYKGIYAVMLAGYMQRQDQIPLLCKLLVRDEDILLEETARALIRIGGDQVVEELKPYLMQDESGIYAADIIANIKSKYAEETLLAALFEVQDMTVKTLIADGLCQQLSVTAIPYIEKLLIHGYDDNMLDLSESLYANCVINGIDHRNLPRWRRQITARRQKLKRLETAMEAEVDMMIDRNQRQEAERQKKRRKIGRNDPCPCGSGKKYKKCCLDKNELFARRTKHWSKEEVEAMSTDEIISRLGFLNIPFDQQQFLRDIHTFQSAEDLSEVWFDEFNVSAEGFDEDFPWFAAQVLWKRLGHNAPPCDEELDGMIQGAYELLTANKYDANKYDGNKYVEACDQWLTHWEIFVQKYEGYQSINDVDKAYKGEVYPSNWCQDIEMYLLNAGQINPRYFEQRIRYCRAFVELFPDSTELIIKNMKRAEAESCFMAGRIEEGEKKFQELIKQYPHWVWGYIGWGDMYAFGEGVAKNLAKAKEIYSLALDIDFDDDSSRLNLEDRLREFEVSDRLN